MTTLKQTRQLAARAAVATRTVELLAASGAFPGAADSTPATAATVDLGALLEDPAAVREVGEYLGADVRTAEGRAAVDVVASASAGADVLAFETARLLGVRSLPAGRAVAAGARVLLVDGAWEGAGGALPVALAALEAGDAEIRACAVVVDHSVGTAQVTSPATGRRYPFRALWRPA